MTPRFEFRIFGEDLRAEREILQSRGAAAGDEESRTDTYFVVRGRIDSSLKSRGGVLDLKILRDRKDGLELWEPAAKTDFPIAPETLQNEFTGPAGVRLGLPETPVDEALLLALARAAPETRIIWIEKHRRRYRVGGVATEHTLLSVEGRAYQTIAIEEADRERAVAAVAALGISDRRNTSYQRFLVESLFADSGGAAV